MVIAYLVIELAECLFLDCNSVVRDPLYFTYGDMWSVMSSCYAPHASLQFVHHIYTELVVCLFVYKLFLDYKTKYTRVKTAMYVKARYILLLIETDSLPSV